MTEPLDDQDLWDEFHRVVNMTSRELADWLLTSRASEDGAPPPDRGGTPLGEHVLRILGKRRGDLTEEDRQVMRAVVNPINAQRRDDLEPTAGDDAWRHRLMSLGHDPLKPA